MIRMEALRTFVEVASHGNIRDAAERLFRTPSAVSMTLKQIEDTLGTALFQSDRKSLLTETGQFLLETATVLLRDYDRTMELVADHAHARRGRLRLASVPSVAAHLLPRALELFLRDRPLVEIELVDTDSTDVRHLVETGQADIGIAGASEPAAVLHFEGLFSDPLLLIARSDAGLGHPGQPLTWSQIEGQQIILNETLRGLESEPFQRLASASRLSVRNVTSLLAMIQGGMGVSLLPALATVNLPGTLSALQVDDLACRRKVGIYRRAGHIESPLVQAFAKLFCAMSRDMAKGFGLTPLEQ